MKKRRPVKLGARRRTVVVRLNDAELEKITLNAKDRGISKAEVLRLFINLMG